MNTSSNPAREKTEAEIVRFPYQEVGGATQGMGPEGTLRSAQKEQQQREEGAREAGRREGEARARTDLESRVQELRGSVAAALEQFARERREYYLAVERAVVQLALGIAHKILRRESNLDPLLLAALVRVSLGQVATATPVAGR